MRSRRRSSRPSSSTAAGSDHVGDHPTPDCDVVIVGARSAGCVLASSLSEDPRRRSCCSRPGRTIPNPVNPAIGADPGERLEWGTNRARPQLAHVRHGPTATNRDQCSFPGGRVVGGSSAINGRISGGVCLRIATGGQPSASTAIAWPDCCHSVLAGFCSYAGAPGWGQGSPRVRQGRRIVSR